MHAARSQHVQELNQNLQVPSIDDAYVIGGMNSPAEYIEYFRSDECAFARVGDLRPGRVQAGVTRFEFSADTSFS